MGINDEYRLPERLLAERSRLEFHYPIGDMIVFIPIYENPEITESKTANLVEYNPLGRSGSLFAYTGAKSRKIKLELKYTLPHLQNFPMGPEKFKRLFSDTKADQRLLFTKWSYDLDKNFNAKMPSASVEAEKRYDRVRNDYGGGKLGKSLRQLRNRHASESAANIYYKTKIGVGQGFGDLDFSQQAADIKDSSLKKEIERLEAERGANLPRNKVLDSLIFFVNIFRTCVDSDASNPIYGPPLIRLTHGTMYQSVPCVCKSVNIEYAQEDWGYDLETLTPRFVKVSLDLAEVRVGDFGKFEPATIVKRDNLAGWESVINPPVTIDPGQLE